MIWVPNAGTPWPGNEPSPSPTGAPSGDSDGDSHDPPEGGGGAAGGGGGGAGGFAGSGGGDPDPWEYDEDPPEPEDYPWGEDPSDPQDPTPDPQPQHPRNETNLVPQQRRGCPADDSIPWEEDLEVSPGTFNCISDAWRAANAAVPPLTEVGGDEPTLVLLEVETRNGLWQVVFEMTLSDCTGGGLDGVDQAAIGRGTRGATMVRTGAGRTVAVEQSGHLWPLADSDRGGFNRRVRAVYCR